MLTDHLENNLEQAGYLEAPGADLYAVLHDVKAPVARVLLLGPFAAERHFSYVPWVKWARFLAGHGISALRYDYRGMGESTGAFEDLSFEQCVQDAEGLARWLKDQSPEAPLILHGLELGGILASRLFAKGCGDALLLWSAPANANEVLRSALLRRIAVEHTFKNIGEPKPLAHFIRQLETDQQVEVEGYTWSGKLWRESLQFDAVIPPESGVDREQRPVRHVKLDRSAAPLVKGSSLGYVVALNPDLTHLYTENLQWITVAAQRKGTQ